MPPTRPPTADSSAQADAATSDAPTGVLLTVAYAGEGFSGWAPQKSGRTVSQVLAAAVAAIDTGASGLRGVSRTDAGVHAEGQRAAFDPSRILQLRNWVLGLNAHLPQDVAVRAAESVPRGFDPRGHVAHKRYRYSLLADRVRDPLLTARTWRIDQPFDVQRLRDEAQLLLGTHDFRAFRSAADERTETSRTIDRVEVIEGATGNARRIDVVVEGKAFMHNMVRIIIGTLLDVARGRIPPGAVSRAYESGDRRVLGVTAPAHGLTLEHVEMSWSGLVDHEVVRWP